MNPYKELANAIIVQAVKDYRDAMERLRYTPDDKSAARQAEYRKFLPFKLVFNSLGLER